MTEHSRRDAFSLVSTPLLPEGYFVPSALGSNHSVRMRRLLESEPYLFGPGVYDCLTAQLVMYYGFKAVYFSGYSFAMAYLGATDMDLYTGTEIANAAARAVSALRRFQLTQAVGDPEKGIAPKYLQIPPLIVDMDAGYGNIFNVARFTELYVRGGVAAAHLEDQVLPKRCGHIGGKALVPANEMIGKLKMMRAVADDCGNKEFVIIARTDAVSAVDAPENERFDRAVTRACQYLDTGIPDLIWCEFPTSDRDVVTKFAEEVRKRFPEARFAFNYSSSFKWFNDPNRLTFKQLGEMGYKFVFITLGAQHATSLGLSKLLLALREKQEEGYVEMQKEEWQEGADIPTKSHHFFSGVPYYHLVGKKFDAARLGTEFVEDLPEDKVV